MTDIETQTAALFRDAMNVARQAPTSVELSCRATVYASTSTEFQSVIYFDRLGAQNRVCFIGRGSTAQQAASESLKQITPAPDIAAILGIEEAA